MKRVRACLLAMLAGGAWTAGGQASPPTMAQARAFMARAESVLYDLSVKGSRADWVASTYITFDTEELTAAAQEAYGNATRDLAMQARRYARLRLPADLRRTAFTRRSETRSRCR